MTVDAAKPGDRTGENPDLAEAVAEFRDCARLLVAMQVGLDLIEQRNTGAMREASKLYWRAATRGRNAKRHARLHLLELLRQGAPVVGWGVDRFPGHLREDIEAVRGVFELDCPAARNANKADWEVWFAFWSVYPEHARLLSDGELARARRLYHREEPNKWLELTELLERIGLGGVRADALATDDRDWRRERARSEISPEKE